MSEITLSQTLWSQSTFDSLLAALRREESDARLRELLGSLRSRGYGIETVSTRVMKHLGPDAALRVRKLGASTRAVSGRPTQRSRYRMTHTRRLQLLVRDARESMQETCDRLRSVLRRH